ncbi:MAG TPA: spore maturation protein [Candidatus Eisenbergiella merdipullorum]|uniref:Spore maturation protein n=1 Tax=Candidatus Eisenbergiella merdipullorum TaxID=2838553 RepID=A0A9D2L076_9FIRM|nr:spore maturation protein [Candidatus Eisenbergiella merdipullorum]
MGNALANLSNIIIPALIFYVVGYGIIHHTNVYEDFIRGAKDGFHTVIDIMPTLIGLMMAVGILRSSGFLEFFGELFGTLTEPFGLPAPVVPVIIVKLFSSSAATGLVLDIFKNYGTDSRIGMMTSILLSCTETCFYTMSVYYMAAKVTKTRYTLTGALLATAAGVAASVLLAGLFAR